MNAIHAGEGNQPRRRPSWTRRLSVLFVLALVGLVLAYYGWGWSNSAALQRELAQLSAAGEPTTVADLRRNLSANQSNGYVHIRAAMAALGKEDANSALERAPDEPLLP